MPRKSKLAGKKAYQPKNMLVTKKPMGYKKRATRSKISLASEINAVINRKAETKMKTIKLHTGTAVPGGGLGNSGSGFGLNVNNLLSVMALDQGIEQEQRIGNKVTNAKLLIRGFAQTLTVSPSNPNTCPYELHMLIYKNKIDGFNNDIQNIKQLPGNNTGNIDGSVMNTCFPYNRDSYTILGERIFRFNQIDLVTAPSLSNQESRATYYRRFTVNIPIKSTLLFRDGAVNTDPTNEYVGVGFYWINGDASNAPSAESRCAITCDAQLSFKDF